LVSRFYNGKYAIYFDCFNLSVLERRFYVQRFTLIPKEDTPHEHLQKPLYKITIPEISVKALGYNFSSRIVNIGVIKFLKPGIQSKQDDEFLEEEQITPLDRKSTRLNSSHV